jgi:predicted nuclease of predicted toxin-antitoxin system
MRFLADAGVSPKTVDFLKQLGHDAVHVRTVGLARAADAELVDRARTDSSIVVTFDLDFGDILALGVLDKPSVIILRLTDERADSVNRHLAIVLAERVTELESGALILVEDARYRVRRLPFGTGE